MKNIDEKHRNKKLEGDILTIKVDVTKEFDTSAFVLP